MTQWNQLAPRERVMVALGGIILVGAFLYLLAWEPFQERLTTARRNVAEQQRDLLWMTQAAAEVRRLQGGGTVSSTPRNNESLLALVDRSARSVGLGPFLKRVEPEGKDKVRVWLDNAGFEKILAWLASLEKTSGVTTESLVVDRQATPGQVNARLVLAGENG